MSEIKKSYKGKWIYWKWNDSSTYSKSYVQDQIITDSGILLELSDGLWHTEYPTRILVNDIIIL